MKHLLFTSLFITSITSCGDYQQSVERVAETKSSASLVAKGAKSVAKGVTKATGGGSTIMGRRIVGVARRGDIRGVKRLIKDGADLTARDTKGDTALLATASQPPGRNATIVRVLAKAGAELEATDDLERTALIRAAQSGHIATLKALIKSGANIEAVDNTGRTALMVVASRPSTWWADRLSARVTVLADAGANLDMQDNSGLTALMHAVNTGNLPVVKRLVKHGADLHVKNKAGKTAVDLLRANAERAERATAIEVTNKINRGVHVRAAKRIEKFLGK